MADVIESIERAQLRPVPRFKAGDTVRVHFRVIEGQRQRIQVFEGIVIKRQGSGARETFTVRKHSFGVGVERTFPLHTPKIDKLEVVAIGDVSRAKLYYLRGKVGKKARIRERRGVALPTVEAQRVAEPEPVDSAQREDELAADAAVREPEEHAAGPGAEARESEVDGTAAEQSEAVPAQAQPAS